MIQINIKNFKELATKQSKLHSLVPQHILAFKVDEVIVEKLKAALKEAGVDAEIVIK